MCRPNPSRPNRSRLSKGILQDHYLCDLEDLIFKRLQNEAATEDAHQTIMHQTGIHDPVLIDELSKLGITAESLVVMRLLPLVCVAWSEKLVDAKEREAILRAARPLGIAEASAAYVLLDHWLRQRPPAETFDAWRRYMAEVTRGISVSARKQLTLLLQKQMTEVAKASGGHLGFGKVSRQEQQTIRRFMAVFNHLDTESQRTSSP